MITFMMNKSFMLAVLALLPTLILGNNNVCLSNINEDNENCIPITAGQHTNVGNVCVSIIDESLTFTYTTHVDESGQQWYIDEVHLWVGTSPTDIPTNKKGNPQIGHFPYKNVGMRESEEEDVKTYVIPNVPIPELANCADGFFYAAHASVYVEDEDGNLIQQETGWSNGDRYAERGMWGTYSTLGTECCDDPTPPGGSDGECETAFAYHDSVARCFLDLTDDAGETLFNRWGWTLGGFSLEPDVHTFPIYAGAGQCDLGKGTLVGDLVVTVTETAITAEYLMLNGFYLNEIHLYVGSDILPDNGGWTVAPGQYPYQKELGNEVSVLVDDIIFDDLTEPFYIVAHAVVCEQI